MTNGLRKLFNAILETELAESTAYLIKTKATLVVELVEKEWFGDDDITKQILNKAIDRIAIESKETAMVHFKSGLIMEMTLS